MKGPPKEVYQCMVLNVAIWISVNAVDISTVIAITKQVVLKYNIEALYMLRSTNHPGKEYLSVMKNFAVGFGVYASVRPVEEMSVRHEWVQHKPLYLIFQTNNVVRSYISKISRSGRLARSTWLMFLEDSKTALEEFFNETYLPLDCGFLVVQGERRHLALIELYRVHFTRPLQMRHVANWSSGSNLDWGQHSTLMRRNDLRDIVIRGVYVPEPPYISKEKEGYSGFCFDVWKELQSRTNFRIEFHTPPEEISYGNLENGTWTGMVGDIIRDNADVGLNVFIISNSRLKVVDYLPPIFDTRMIVHIRRPGLGRGTFQHLVILFSPTLWNATIVTCVLFALVMSATRNVATKYRGCLPDDGFKFKDSWLYVIGIVCRQGHYTMPEPWSLRVLFLTIHVMLLVIFVAYTAQFISFLANRTPVLPFSTFEDLLTDRTYSLGVIKNSAREAFFKNSVDPVLRGIFKKLIGPVQRRPNNDEDGLRRLCADPQHGYFCSQISVRSLALKLPCSVAEIPEAYYSVSLAMTISKNSPYRRLLSYNLREMKRTGILKRIEMLHWPKFADKLDYGAPSVSFGTVIIFYYLLLGGMLAAVAILIIEHIVRHLRRRIRRDAPKSISSILASEKRRQLKAKAVFPYGLNMDKVN